MGYDMHFVRRGDNDYFRLNVWGMGICTEVMYGLGMVYQSNSPGDWPEWDRYPDDKKKQELFESAYEHIEDGAGLGGEVPPDIMAAAREYVAQGDVIRRAHPDGGDAIPAHKFGSNDGWIVTPQEILVALAAYESVADRDEYVALRLGSDGGKAYWDQWIDYLRRAVDADGFEVW